MRWKLQVGRLTHWPVESTISWKLLYESFLPFQSGFRELFLQLHLNEAEVAGAWLHHFFFFSRSNGKAQKTNREAWGGF